MSSVRERYGEAFWRAHHEAWVQSELNQREHCEAYWIPLKAFGSWREKFKAEPQTPARQVLYRRGSLSHAVSHGLSHGLSHDLRPTIAPAREGRRRKFSEGDKRQIFEQAILERMSNGHPMSKLDDLPRGIGPLQAPKPDRRVRNGRLLILAETRLQGHPLILPPS